MEITLTDWRAAQAGIEKAFAIDWEQAGSDAVYAMQSDNAKEMRACIKDIEESMDEARAALGAALALVEQQP